MLYTVIDEQVFMRQLAAKETPSCWYGLKNGRVEVNGSGQVKRICSTDLQDYLKSDLMPGHLYRHAEAIMPLDKS